ncbi:MAG: SpoIIE family protein phosphatase [Armatimonadetes bacterium]|nr:SpoIIE family protein phosphatase [Armatimonadota bacterium]
MRVLVVDDEEDVELLIRQRFRRQIREGEIHFSFARNGVEAMVRIAEEPDIEIVLTDINMPEMDGLTLLVHLKELDRVLRSVVVSAYGDLDNIRTAMNRGAFDFLTKPIDFADLHITLEKTIRNVEEVKSALATHSQLENIQRELQIASDMQQSVLPSTFPPFPERTDLDIYARMTPAREIGGDFYDFFMLDEDRLGIIVADVSGKGIPAALYMMLSRALVRGRALQGLSPSLCLKEANDMLCVNNPTSMFVTLFYGLLNLATGELTYCNGGHNPPMLVTPGGSAHELRSVGGPLLGGFDGVTYREGTRTMLPGEYLFLYTDGVTEAENRTRAMLGAERLAATLERHAGLAADGLVQAVFDDVQAFADGAVQSDDITAMAVRRLGPTQP